MWYLPSNFSESLIATGKECDLMEDGDWRIGLSAVPEEHDENHMVCVIIEVLYLLWGLALFYYLTWCLKSLCILNHLIAMNSRPSIRFSSDEAVACRMATNEIQFFDTEDFSKGIVNRFRIPGVAAVELSRSPGTHVAAYVPESKVCHSKLHIFC